MHKLECSAMNAFGQKWCPSEITRLVARILTRKVRENPPPPSSFLSQPLAEPWFIVALFPQKMQQDRCASEKLLLVGEMQSRE